EVASRSRACRIAVEQHRGVEHHDAMHDGVVSPMDLESLDAPAVCDVVYIDGVIAIEHCDQRAIGVGRDRAGVLRTLDANVVTAGVPRADLDDAALLLLAARAVCRAPEATVAPVDARIRGRALACVVARALDRVRRLQ